MVQDGWWYAQNHAEWELLDGIQKFFLRRNSKCGSSVMHRKTSSIPPSSINCYLLNLPCITLKSWDTFFQRAVSSSSKIHHPYKFFPPKHSLNQLPSIGLFGLFDFGREWGTTSSVSDLQPQPRLDPSTKGSASEPRGVTALVRIDETLVTETQPEMMASQNQLRPKISIGKAGKACYLDFGWFWMILVYFVEKYPK